MIYNFPENSIEIRSLKTGKDYIFVCAGQVYLNDDSVTQITNVCNESEVYNNVFSTIFKDKRYSADNARTFIKLISEGSKCKNRFDWLILYEGAIVGTVGIKSLDGEIGYWQSNKHPGVMASAVQKLCTLAKDAGFTSLWAHVKKSNIASIRVLENAGFKLDLDLTKKHDDLYKYRSTFFISSV